MKSFPILYKRAKTGSPQSWQIFVEDNQYWTAAGQVGGVITKSEPTTCEGKNIGRANETTASEQAIAEAQSKWQKKVDRGYFESLNDIDEGTSYFEPMLAKKFENEKHKIDWSKGCIIQPKLDGIRAIITKDGATTRNGKEHKAIPHILKALKPLFDIDPNLIIDGEVYNHLLHDDFNKIASVVRKTKPTAFDLEESARLAQFHCYDTPRVDIYNENSSYLRRREEFIKLMNKTNIKENDCFQLVHNIRIFEEADVKSAHAEFVSQGYEGIIVRIADAPYEHKRSDNLLKYKVFDDDEFVIEGVLPGKGNKANMAGSIELHSKSGEYFTSNIKAPHDVLTNMLKNKSKYIGKTCTVRYFGLTPDKEIPRFPYVIDMDRWTYE